MAEVLLFRPAQGLTAGCLAFADDLRAADGRPAELVSAGFSLGVLPAQTFARTRPGQGSLLFHACVPTSAPARRSRLQEGPALCSSA